MSTAPRTARGTRTRARLLEAAEQVFESVGYHDASIVKITEQAGIGLGTFYLYFEGKQAIFDEVVEDLNRRVRQAMTEAAKAAGNRIEAERAGFRAFFRFTAEHPALYRIIRQAEFVSPGALRMHYTRIVNGYVEGLKAARDAGEIRPMDVDTVAWALMGIGEMLGMRWVLWHADRSDGGTAPEIPEAEFEEMMRFIERGMAPEAPENGGGA